jgi:ankyrin repeat protein
MQKSIIYQVKNDSNDKIDMTMASLELLEKIKKGDTNGIKVMIDNVTNKTKSSNADNNMEHMMNMIYPNGCTLLFYSAWNGQEDICRLLIQAGANVKQSVKGYRPIHVAASKNHGHEKNLPKRKQYQT